MIFTWSSSETAGFCLVTCRISPVIYLYAINSLWIETRLHLYISYFSVIHFTQTSQYGRKDLLLLAFHRNWVWAVVKKNEFYVSQTVCGLHQLTCQIGNLFFMIELLYVKSLHSLLEAWSWLAFFYQDREVTLLDLFICLCFRCMPCANVILGKLYIHKGVFMTTDTTILTSSAFQTTFTGNGYAGCSMCYQIRCSLDTLLSLFLEMGSA